MTAPTPLTPPHARRWAMPWASMQTALASASRYLTLPTPQALHITVTTGIGIDVLTPLAIARGQASCLTQAELDTALSGAREACRLLALGRGTQAHWISLCSALNVARAIEDGGAVRGLTEHLDSIERAINAISRRACKSEQLDTWTPPALWAAEIDAIRLLVTLYTHQLKHLSYAEYQAAWRLATARVQSARGQVLNRQALKGIAA